MTRIVPISKDVAFRQALLDAAVRYAADRIGQSALNARTLLGMWLDDPEYLIPRHTIRVEFARLIALPQGSTQ